MIYDNEDDNKGSVVKWRVQPGHFPALANVAEEPFLHNGGVPNSKYISRGQRAPKGFTLVSRGNPACA